MDERHAYNCARYVEMNPVRAGLVARPEQWRHSSARAHLRGKDDGLVKVRALLEQVEDWRAYLWESEEGRDEFRRHERTGRPLGSVQFVGWLEKLLGRDLMKRKPGPKRRRSRR